MLQSLADISLLNDGRGIPWLGLGVYQAAGFRVARLPVSSA